MTTERREFLDRLRAGLAVPSPANLPHPLVDIDAVPEPRPRRAAGDLLAELCLSVERSGAVLHQGTLESVIEAVVEQHSVSSALISADPEVNGSFEMLTRMGVTVSAFDGPTSARDVGLGVVGCRWAIASTGSLVLDAARAGGRTASLVPPVVLAFVDPDRVLATPSALFRHISTHYPKGPPSQLVLHTGPSRSGDIEGILTRGVHGPGTVHVGLLTAGGGDL